MKEKRLKRLAGVLEQLNETDLMVIERVASELLKTENYIAARKHSVDTGKTETKES